METRKKPPFGMVHIALAITLLAWIVVDLGLLRSLFALLSAPLVLPTVIEQIVLTVIVNILISGSVVYLVTQAGYSKRLFEHTPYSRKELEQLYDGRLAPSLTIIVPSYREEPAVVRQTLLSAALVEYPSQRVVLLIDDPPHPGRPEDARLLQELRNLCTNLDALLADQAAYYQSEELAFEERATAGSVILGEELSQLAFLYQKTASWFEEQVDKEASKDHAAEFFVQKILREPAAAHRARAWELRMMRREQRPALTLAQIGKEYRRLACLFRTKIGSFERKQYVNLSHEPNKAMNLNSYISLIGESWETVQTQDKKGIKLLPAKGHKADLNIPAADYLITLDADSLLLPDYALTLIRFMELPERQRIAVAQTPYSAFPGAPDLTEKIAGATTDMQYRIHQGFTEHNATFWVGANALLRMTALTDIVTVHEENGFAIKKFIQDRTVIEDTESSIDLIQRGWRLHNFPERLAYSATPPDFGSLLIQRRRWANGGLIVFPKLLRYLLRGPDRRGKIMEGFLRTHYLTSLAGTNFALLLFIIYGFYHAQVSPWLFAAILPLFLIVALSLKSMGYRYSDLFRVVALNLLLVPVNLSGVMRSIRQVFSGKRVPFGRTPKVVNRTAVPAGIVIAEYGLAAYSLIMALINYFNGFWLVAVFCALNGLLFFYAIYRFIGVKNSIFDVVLATVRSLAIINSRVISPGKAGIVTRFERGMNLRKRPTPLS